MKGTAGQRVKYLPEPQAEPAHFGRSVGCAACERYKRKGVAHSGACTREAVPREGAANRGGTAIFSPSAKFILAGGVFCPSAQET